MKANSTFTGKAVFITGGASGTGRAVCEAFAAAGAMQHQTI